MIPYGRQSINEEDIAAVVAAFVINNKKKETSVNHVEDLAPESTPPPTVMAEIAKKATEKKPAAKKPAAKKVVKKSK